METVLIKSSINGCLILANDRLSSINTFPDLSKEKCVLNSTNGRFRVNIHTNSSRGRKVVAKVGRSAWLSL